MPAASTDPQRHLVYAGIDEAGYGPLLGPLCLGLTVFRAPLPDAPVDAGEKDQASAGDARAPEARRDPRALRPPDLWRALRAAVCKEPRHARSGRLVVNDSKRVKLANDRPSRAARAADEGGVAGAAPADGSAGSPLPLDAVVSAHALTHLEAGVLCFLASRERADEAEALAPSIASIASDVDLLRALGADLEGHPWYAGRPLPLPVAHTHASLTIRANCLRAALDASGIACLALRARAVGESAFNEGCRRYGSKAAVNFLAAASLLRIVWERWGAVDGAQGDEGGPRVVIDRHGGRMQYAPALQSAFPEAAIEILDERDRVSRYRLRAPGRALTVLFQVEAEQAHLPVALASMTAKYVRELAMGRLNRHFTSRAPSLAPTAGYAQDARRWLRDASPILTADVRRTLVRVR